jgi:opacity protein-like surface antigen
MALQAVLPTRQQPLAPHLDPISDGGPFWYRRVAWLTAALLQHGLLRPAEDINLVYKVIDGSRVHDETHPEEQTCLHRHGEREAVLKIRWDAQLITNLAFFLGASLVLTNVSSAADISHTRGIYIGVFGGVGILDETNMQQVGTVITSDIRITGINVDGRGSAESVVAPIAGVQFGYEFKQWDVSTSRWSVGVAAEIEGLYLAAEPEGVLDIDPYLLGTQYVSLPLNVGAVLVSAVLNLRTPLSEAVTPYAGVGAGYGAVSIRGSNSTNPSEPGINHFNSEPDASSGGLALQAKIGVRGEVANNWSVFTEFRHIYIASTDYTFGQTDYPGEHLPTTEWSVNLGQQNYSVWVFGMGYHF